MEMLQMLKHSYHREFKRGSLEYLTQWLGVTWSSAKEFTATVGTLPSYSSVSSTTLAIEDVLAEIEEDPDVVDNNEDAFGINWGELQCLPTDRVAHYLYKCTQFLHLTLGFATQR